MWINITKWATFGVLSSLFCNIITLFIMNCFFVHLFCKKVNIIFEIPFKTLFDSTFFQKVVHHLQLKVNKIFDKRKIIIGRRPIPSIENPFSINAIASRRDAWPKASQPEGLNQVILPQAGSKQHFAKQNNKKWMFESETHLWKRWTHLLRRWKVLAEGQVKPRRGSSLACPAGNIASQCVALPSMASGHAQVLPAQQATELFLQQK